MIRNVRSTIAGLLVGSFFNMAVVQLNAAVLFPMAPGTSMDDPEQMKAWVATLPAVAFLCRWGQDDRNRYTHDSCRLIRDTYHQNRRLLVEM